jgi:putative addiction module component (TIGR02574 family)
MGYSDAYGGGMTKPAKEILNAAIKLPEKERLQIVEELLASLDPVADDAVDAAWVEEVEKRSREIKEGTVRPLPWEDVRSAARKRVRGGS